MISTASDLIDALGGTGKVAEFLGVQASTVSTWRVRPRLPAWACARLEDAGRQAGLDVDPVLFEIPSRARSAA
jgi:hypothetical protein